MANALAYADVSYFPFINHFLQLLPRRKGIVAKRLVICILRLFEGDGPNERNERLHTYFIVEALTNVLSISQGNLSEAS